MPAAHPHARGQGNDHHPNEEQTRMDTHSRHRRHAIRCGVLACLLAVAGCRKPAAAFHGIDVTGADYGSDFRLNDPEGRKRTLADFKGKAVMMFFGFTQCPDVCPTALARAAEVKRLLGADGERLQVLFVTLDPERDKPEVLKAYTAAFDPSFIGLYADAPRTAETAQHFKVYFKKVPTGNSYTLDHSALSYVYDPSGRLRLVLRHEQSTQEYADDLRQLLHSA
jgi:protein SCO1/2